MTQPKSSVDLEALKLLVDKFEVLPVEEGDYAERVIEDDPESPIQICDKEGRMKVLMSKKTWDVFQGAK